MARMGYWADVTQMQLSEKGDKLAGWVHALSVGAFDHPAYGTVNITPVRVQRFADNVKSKVRGIDPSINYDHINMGDAAGWVTDAESRPNGLWLFVEWTKAAADKIKARAYRYFSAEFDDEWEDPKSQQRYEDVIFGGALTNRPFLKDLVPVNLSELTGDSAPAPNNTQEGEGEGMDPKVLRQSLGLAETATDQEVMDKIKALSESKAPPAPPANPPAATQPATPADPPNEQDVAKLLSELVDTSNNPAVKALGELVRSLQSQLETNQKSLHEQQVDKQLAELDKVAEARNIAIPPATVAQLKHVLMNSPKQLGDMVFNAYVDTIKLGVIELGEHGWQRISRGGSPAERFEELVQTYMETHKGATKADAYQVVAAENPELYGEYRTSSYIVVE